MVGYSSPGKHVFLTKVGAMTEKPKRLGELLIEAQVLNEQSLGDALAMQKERQMRLGTILLQEGFVSESQLVEALSRQLSIPWVNLWHINISDEILQLVPVNVAEEFFLIPVYVRGTDGGEHALYVAMNDPTDDAALRFVSATAGMTVKPMIAGPSDIAAAIRAYYYGEEASDDETEERKSTPPPGRKSSQPPAPAAAPPPPPAPPAAHAPPVPPAAHAPHVPVAPPPTPAPRVAQEEPIDPQPAAVAEEPRSAPVEQAVPVAQPEATAPVAAPSEEDAGKRRREVEKEIFGIGQKRKRRGFSLTLLDGTTLAFGGAPKTRRSETFTEEDLLAGLQAAAAGTPLDGFLPADKWEAYMAALLRILFRKHLVMFDEIVEELKAGKDDKKGKEG
jgi:type IV pilus assembly protein PilB